MSEQVVVTGATGAVGAQLCRSLSAQGFTVVAVARDAQALANLAGQVPGLVACPADVGDAGIGDRLADAVTGPVRMIVHAVGLPATGPTATVDPDALGQAVSIKVGGLLRVVRAVDGRLSPGSRVVAIGGHFGNEPSITTCTPGVANAALANLIRQLADLYGPRGITVHLVAPGPLESARLERIAAATAQRRGVDVETVLGEYRAKSPLGRLVTIEQVDWMIRTLLSPAADALHGATLALDGGSRRGLF
jgi:NAD(P)-dependent dehydrogenase (short-subunit alcohol dehydrogenase family)